MENRKGVSSVVTTLIIIGLSIVAVGIVWGVVSNILNSEKEKTTSLLGQVFINLEIKKVNLNPNGDIEIMVEKDSAAEDLESISFVISDGKNTKSIKKPTNLAEVNAEVFTLSYSELGPIGPGKISVVPILSSNGKETIGNPTDTWINSEETWNTYSNPGTSCKDLLSVSRGDGIYWVNYGGEVLKVYCDMTSDGGGWTLIAVCVPEDNPSYPGYNSSVPGSDCWKTGAVGLALDPNSKESVKLSDTLIRTILNQGDKMTRGHWTQRYRYDALSPVDVFIYNLISSPDQWSSSGGGTVGKKFYVKYNYTGNWGPELSTLSVGCSSPSNGWSNQHYTATRGESCGSYGAWHAGCEAGPSSSHCCACVKYDERANVVVYAR